MTDITPFMSKFIELFLYMLGEIYDTLSNIQFFGFSLLTYFISLFVLLAVIPLVITIISTTTTRASGRGEVIMRKGAHSAGKRLDKAMSPYDNMIDELKDY